MTKAKKQPKAEDFPKSIDAWETSDDNIFVNFDEAEAHEKMCRYKRRLQWFADNHFFTPMTASDAVDVMYENLADVIALTRGMEAGDSSP